MAEKYTKKQKELLAAAIQKSLDSLGKIISNCLKEGQTEAAKSVMEDINTLQDLKATFEGQK